MAFTHPFAATQLAKEAKDLIQERMGDIQNALPSGSGAMSAASGAAGLGSLPGLSDVSVLAPEGILADPAGH